MNEPEHAAPIPAAPAWRNRIVGKGTEQPGQLLANPRNWRIHPKAQQDGLRAVLKTVGWVAEVIVNQRTGFVVDGHARISIALQDEEPEIPVSYVDLSDEEEAIVLASLDSLTAMAGTDREQLKALIEEIPRAEPQLDALFAAIAKRESITLAGRALRGDIDDVPEPPAEPTTKPGQLWALGGHRLLCGDATKVMSYSRLLGSEKADCVFTDPPYGVDYTGGMKPREPLAGDDRGTGIYDESIPHMVRWARDDAAFYIFYADLSIAAAAAAAAAAGLVVRCQVIWAKNHAQFMSNAHYHGKHEPMIYAGKRGKSLQWFGPKNEVTLWEYDRAPANEYHPTQKPVALAERALRNSCRPNGIVLDPFGGSGSTLLGAESTGRRAFLMELRPAYCDVILARFERATGIVPTLLEPDPESVSAAGVPKTEVSGAVKEPSR